MKYIFSLLLVLIFQINSSSQGIEFFHGTWKEALEKAKAEEKVLFVDCYATWCGPCKMMASRVFTLDEVGEFFNQNFINLKLDMEQMDGRKFESNYPVSAYPTLYFLDGEGKILKKVRGAQQKESLLQLAEEAIKANDQSGKYAEMYEGGNRDFDVVLKYITTLNSAGKPSLKIANEYLQEYGSTLDESQRSKILFNACTEADSKIFNEMIDHKKNILKYYTEEEWNNKIIAVCNETVKKSIDFEMKDLLDEALDKSKYADKSTAEKFRYQAGMTYGYKMGDEKMYYENAKNLYKKIGKNDPQVLSQLVVDLNANHSNNEDCRKLAEDCGEKLYKGNKNGDNLILYAKTLVANGKTNEAMKLTDEAIEKNADNPSEMQKLNALKRFLDAKM
ncbi:MAG: thioredoxin domain-containing protein [Saprospiraceae bacterium]